MVTSAQMQLADDLVNIEGTFADRERLVLCMLDFTAAVLAGSTTPLGRSLAERYLAVGARGYAFTLAYLAEISEFSHGHSGSAGHIGSTTLPIILAMAAWRGEHDLDWSAAALAGYEASARFGQSLMPELARWGSITTGFSASLGAAAAVARIEGMDAADLCAALGQTICLTPLTPAAACLAGVTPAGAAVATTTGILATELVAAGANRSDDILDEVYARIAGRPPSPAFARDGTRRLAVHDLYFKPYACCRFTHGAIEATLNLVQAGLAPSDIEEITVRTTPRGVEVCAQLPLGPETTHLERQFSIPYVVGLAVLRRAVTPEDILSPPPDLDDAVHTFARRHVVVESDKDLERFETICPAVVSVRDRRGRTVEHKVPRPLGCLDTPMTQADIEAKFQQMAASLLDTETAAQWQDLARGLAWREMGQSLWRYLSGSEPGNGWGDTSVLA